MRLNKSSLDIQIIMRKLRFYVFAVFMFITPFVQILEVERFSNYDLESVVMPLDVKHLYKLLCDASYDPVETRFLVEGFTNGFDIGYQGPKLRQSRSTNIPFTVGDKYDLWGKIMKEVEAKRFAGPYDEIPFDNFIQSPIGLVPKANNKMRLIFHLSYQFGEQDDQQSVNAGTPREICSVRYNDLDAVIKCCIDLIREFRDSARSDQGEGHDTESSPTLFLGKTDLLSAFHVLPLLIECIHWLMMMAQDPTDGKWKYFIDKCLPFGASISCAHYQRFLNDLCHIVEVYTGKKSITNYLDDFLFVALARILCNALIQAFLNLCQELNIPVAIEKTEWGCMIIVFLGILLDGKNHMLSIPLEKRDKALALLQVIEDKKKITIKQLQVLTGYLNFLTKAIYSGRVFTRHIYVKFGKLQLNTKTGKTLKSHHHVKIDNELRFDCATWRVFLDNFRERVVCHPMIDWDQTVLATDICFYSDASKNECLGMGAIY